MPQSPHRSPGPVGWVCLLELVSLLVKWKNVLCVPLGHSWISEALCGRIYGGRDESGPWDFRPLMQRAVSWLLQQNSETRSNWPKVTQQVCGRARTGAGFS